MTIKEILNTKTVAEMKNCCTCIGMTGVSKYRKSELIEKLTEWLSSPEAMTDLLLVMSDSDFKCCKKAIRSSNAVVDRAMNSLSDSMYALTEFSQEPFFIQTTICEEFMHFPMENLKKPFYDERKRLRKISQYLEAFVGFYGMIEVEKACDFYNQYENENLDVKIFFSACHKLIRGSQMYYIVGDLVVSNVIEPDEVGSLMVQQENKPYAFLPKSELLKYASLEYVYQPPVCKEVCSFLVDYFGIPLERAKNLTEEIAVNFNFDANLSYPIFCLEREGFVFESFQDLNIFTGLIRELNNTSRMWENRGYTPNELSKLMTTCNKV